MKKIIKNSNFWFMGIGILISLISVITFFFIKNRNYFTTMFVIDIIINFIVTSLILLTGDQTSINVKFKSMGLYLLITLFLLISGVLVISNFWDVNNYSNLMYVTNVKLYVGIYSIFVLIIILAAIFGLLKNGNLIRQKSSKE